MYTYPFVELKNIMKHLHAKQIIVLLVLLNFLKTAVFLTSVKGSVWLFTTEFLFT